MFVDFDLITKIKVEVELLDKDTQQPIPNMPFNVDYAGKIWQSVTDDKGKSVLPTVYNIIELNKNFQVKIDGTHPVYKKQDCEDLVVNITFTKYQCKLAKWELMKFNLKIDNLAPCVDVQTTLIAERSIKMTSNVTKNKGVCQVELEASESTG